MSIDQLLNKPTGKDSDAAGTPTTKILLAVTMTQEKHNQTLPPPEASSKMEYLTVAQEVPPETHPTETEVQIAQKSTLWRTLGKTTISAEKLKTKASDFEGTYSPSQEKTTEAMTRTPQEKHTTYFGTRSPASFPNEIVQRTTTRPSEKAVFLPLSHTRATHTEYVTETSTPIETKRLLVMGNSKSEDVNGPLHSTEGYSFTLREKQSDELVHQSVSSSGNERGNFTYVPPMDGIWAKATSSPKAPENSTATSHPARVEAAMSSEAGSQAYFTTSILSGTGEEETGSSYRTKESGPAHTQHSSTRSSSLAVDFEQTPYTEEAPALGHSEVQDHHLGQIGATVTATSSWALITSHLPASRRKETILPHSSPMVPFRELESASLPTGNLTRKDRWEENVTPSGALFETEWVQATEMPRNSGQAPKQIHSYSFTQPTSLAIETNQAMLPTERSPLPGASWSQNPVLLEQKGLILQPSNTAKYDLRTLVGKLTTSPDVQAEGSQVKQTIAAAFSIAMQSTSIEPKVTVSQGEQTESNISVGTEETEVRGKKSMQGTLAREPVKSQMPSYTQVGWTESSQPHTDVSLVPGIIGEQNDDAQARLKRTTFQKQEMAAASSGAKFSSVELKTEGLSFLDTLFKLGSTSQPSPRTEVKGRGSSLEGILLPMHDTRTAITWVSGSKNTGFGHSMEVLKGTTSSAVSNQEHTAPYKRTISEITVRSKGTSGVSSIGSSSFSATLALGNQTSEYKEDQTKSPPLWNMQSTWSSESLSSQFLSKLSSKPREMRPFTEEEHINLANATKELLLGMKWTTTDVEEDTAQKATISPLLDKQSTTVSRATTLPLTTGLLKSPKFVSYNGEPAIISPIKETLPSTLDRTTASMVYSATAVPIQTLEIQTSIPVEVRDVTSRKASTEIYRMPPSRVSSVGLHEGHDINTVDTKVIGIPQLSLEPETIWPTYKTVEGKQTKPFLEKGKSEKTTAENLGSGLETTAENGGGIIPAATTAAKLVYQSALSSPSFMEEPTNIHGKKEAMNISVGPTRKLVLEMVGSPIPSDGRTTEMVLSIPDGQNNLDSEKTKTTLRLEISSEGMYLTDMESTEGVTATTGVSLGDPQTLSPNEVRIQLKYHKQHVSQGLKGGNGYSGLLPTQGSPSLVSNERLLGPSESSMPASEIHTAIRQEEMSQMKKVAPEHKNHSSVENPISGHQLGEKSLLEKAGMTAFPHDSDPEDELPS